jgi:nucleotidyltransferase/DNA polymerase involved in DNA repair
VLAVSPEQVADWLGPLPVDALPGIGPRQAQLLRDYGIHCVGLLAALPSATMQRLLGGRAGRLAADRARGIDPRPVAPRSARNGDRPTGFCLPRPGRSGGPAPPCSSSSSGSGPAAPPRPPGRALSLVLTFAGGSRWEKIRRLTEPSAHDDDLRAPAYQLMEAAGLQRGRLVQIALQGEDLVDADQIAQQISLDDVGEDRLVAEVAVDRVRKPSLHRVVACPDDLVDHAAGYFIQCIDACLTVSGGVTAGRKQRHRRRALDHSQVRGGVDTAVEYRQPQGQEFLTLVAPSPASTCTPDSTVSIGLMALEQPRRLVRSVRQRLNRLADLTAGRYAVRSSVTCCRARRAVCLVGTDWERTRSPG